MNKSKFRSLFVKTSFILFQIILFSSSIFAQPKEGFKLKKENTYLGGNLGLSLGTNSTYIDVSPHVGYYLSDQISIGIGATYKYSRGTLFNYNFGTGVIMGKDRFTGQYYGGQIFTRFHLPQDLPGLLSGLFAHAEYEPLRYSYTIEEFDGNNNSINKSDGTIFVNNVFIGAGLMQNVGVKSSSYIMVLWNLNETYESPYANPLFRVGFTFRL